MHGQLTPGRYKDPVIREHLVGQYLLGTLSRRTRHRLEALMSEDLTWYERVIPWHSQLSRLEKMTEETPPSRVWRNIAAVLNKENTAVTIHPENNGRWTPLLLACTAALFLISGILLMMTESRTHVPGYMAVMSSDVQTDAFVLMAYPGDKPGKSSMRLEWNVRSHPDVSGMQQAMLWAKDKDTGQAVLLGRFSDVKLSRLLTPSEWNTVKNSSELFITENNNPGSRILFRGACIALSSSTA